MLDQQDFLKIAVAAQTSAAIPVTSGTSRLRFGEPQPFSYEWLKSHAQDLFSPLPSSTSDSPLQPGAMCALWGVWENPMKPPRRRYFWPRMTPFLSRASNYSLMVAEPQI